MFYLLKYELFRGLAYRTIKHPNIWIYTRLLPSGLAAIMLAVYYSLPVSPPLVGKDALFSAALSVLSTLPGFYFAGLAAVATFANVNMDREMPAPAPTIQISIQGQAIQTPLTRRQFMSYLFSYLVIISFALCAVLLILNGVTGSLAAAKHGINILWNGFWILQSIKLISLSLILFLFGSLVTSTLHGIYFLTERLHQP